MITHCDPPLSNSGWVSGSQGLLREDNGHKVPVERFSNKVGGGGGGEKWEEPKKFSSKPSAHQKMSLPRIAVSNLQ